MAQPFVMRVAPGALALMLLAGCASSESDVQQHAEKIESARATAVAVVKAWLAGEASGAYTRSTLERSFQLVEQERSAVAATPHDLAAPAANAVAAEAEELARVLAALTDAIGRRDESSARRQLDDLMPRESAQP